jgi:hypothetical protein
MTAEVRDVAQVTVSTGDVHEDFQTVEKLLELVPTKGKQILMPFVYMNCSEKMVGFVSDGAPSLIGEKNGVAAKLKRNKVKEFEVSNSFFSFHRILHQEVMCAEGSKMHHVMYTVIKTVNIIHASVRNYREFVGLLEETENEHTENNLT